MKLTDERIYELADSDRCNPDNSGWGPKFSPLEFARAIEAEVLRITGDRRGEAVAWHQQDAVPSITPPQQEQAAPVQDGWMPIETAPKDGRTMLLGYPNRLGKWRTVRGQWMSDDYISEFWEEPEDRSPGWFETCEEGEEVPNCWPIDPTHWMPLPAAPKQEPGT